MKTKNSFHPLCPNIEIVARAAVRGPWWCCGLVVMQPAYTTTPYTIQCRGSLIKFNIRTRTSYHTTILGTLLLCTLYRVLDVGCILMPRTMLHRTRYQLQRAVGTPDTIVKVFVKTPRQFRYLYRHIPLSLLLASFWTSCGLRCRPFPPVRALSFYLAHRVQHSHCSSTFIECC